MSKEIKANELRVGNYVSYYHLKDEDTVMPYSKIQSIQEAGDYEACVGLEHNKHMGVSISIIKPVPLTEEILLKCGFEKWFGHKNNSYELNGFKLFTHSKGGVFYSPNKNTKGTYLKNLHQLQNLYFALTGEELNVEL